VQEQYLVTRSRSKPHQFNENLDREKSRLEALLASLPEGDEYDQTKRKLYEIEAARKMNVWLAVKS
jgi:hypothetical protein